tara:strand:- start:480 stop:722 length:243 start_codon:yes stop_codon:yes gene_type:complete
MRVEYINNVVHYYADNYEFTLSDEKFHRYATLVVRPTHLNLIDNQTNLSDQDLKEQIIQDWFAEENDIVRESNNKKRRKQ